VVPLGELFDELRQRPSHGPPWTMALLNLPTRGLGPLIFLLKNISFSVIFQENCIEAPEFCSNFNLALSFEFYLKI
jgi:hypothetical protein